MLVNLLELLRDHAVEHPSRFVSADLSDNGLALVVRGFAWWNDLPGTDEQNASFRFTAISDGSLDLWDLLHPEQDELLDTFEVARMADLLWAGPDTCQVFCHAPLPDPLSLYADLQERLRLMQAAKGAREFLNVGNGHGAGLKTFARIVSQRTYAIARGPKHVCQIVCNELVRQHVPFNIISSTGQADHRLFVRINDSWLFCERATAEFSDS